MPIQEIASILLLGVGVTLLITGVSFVAGAIIAIPLALGRLSKFAFLRFLSTSIVEIIRGVPTLIWLMLFYFGMSNFVKMSPITAAMIGLSIIAAAYLSENYRAGLENVPTGQVEAAQAIGLSSSQSFWRIRMPQAVGLAIPPSTSYLIGLLKESAIASVIGVADILFQAGRLVNGGQPALSIYLAAGLLYLVLSTPIAGLSRWADSSLRKRTAQ